MVLLPPPKKRPANLLLLAAVAPITVVNPEYSVAPLNANLLLLLPIVLLPDSILFALIESAVILPPDIVVELAFTSAAALPSPKGVIKELGLLILPKSTSLLLVFSLKKSALFKVDPSTVTVPLNVPPAALRSPLNVPEAASRAPLNLAFPLVSI